jgi:small subunit ribosomal protein S4
MARYTGPVCRLCRRQGEKLMLKGDRCMTPKCAIERRNVPPGQQQSYRRRKISERGQQLREKQKVRYIYGVLEGQFRRHFEEAERRPGITGENLLRILEMRLDNAVYRLGLADSRSQARQIVRHGHIALNGRRTDIPSARVKIGDEIRVMESSRQATYFKDLAQRLGDKSVPNWLSRNDAQLSGRILAEPMRSDIEGRINEQAIVEFYSR